MFEPRKCQVSGSMVLYRNSRDQVAAAIRSFVGSDADVSLIVVDNSPTDELQTLVTSLGATYWWSGKNLGFGAGHNRAIREYRERSKYHLVLNPDVTFEADVVPTLAKFLEDHCEIGMAMPRILYPDGSEQHLCKLLPSPIDLLSRRFGGRMAERLLRRRLDRYQLRSVNLHRSCNVPALSGCFMFLRSEILHRTGGFDERFFMYLEDVDLSRRVGEISETAFFPYVSIRHGYEKGSYRNPLLLKYHLKSAFRYFNKWGWFWDRARDAANLKAGQQI